MDKPVLILDLDGVLITTSPWKADEIAEDGYSKFNPECVSNLNTLLSKANFEIWLSSTRRTVKSLEEFNSIFENREIQTSITGFLPEYAKAKSRREEIELFLNENDFDKYLILDDDKSLNDLTPDIKKNLVQTELLTGFDSTKLDAALEAISTWH